MQVDAHHHSFAAVSVDDIEATNQPETKVQPTKGSEIAMKR